MAKRGLQAILVAGVVLAAASGCANTPSTYATVNGERISTAEYTEIAESVRDSFRAEGVPESGLPQKSDVGQILIVGTIVEQRLAAEDKLPGPSEQAQALRDNGLGSLLDRDEHTRDFAEKFAMVATAPDDAVAWLSEADVELNPRFGTWEPGKSLQSTTGSLSEAAPAQG